MITNPDASASPNGRGLETVLAIAAEALRRVRLGKPDLRAIAAEALRRVRLGKPDLPAQVGWQALGYKLARRPYQYGKGRLLEAVGSFASDLKQMEKTR